MDSEASFSFWMVGVVVVIGMLARRVLVSVFCVLKISSIIKKLNSKLMFLSSLKCEMNVISQGRRGYIVSYGSRIWTPTFDTDPQKQSVLSGRVGNILLACLFVCTTCLFVIRLVC